MATNFEHWLTEMKIHAESREKNIQYLKKAKHLDDQCLRSLDSTLKKVTTFTKKLKNIGSVSIAHLMPDLDKLNLSKYLDEIAVNICDAKIKISDLEALITFCVKFASLYKEFPTYLIQEFRKQMPTKKGDKIDNPSKLRVDLRFFSELLLNGLFDRDGLQLFGSVLAFLIQTDKHEHVNVSVLMPFCRYNLLPITGIVPLSIAKTAKIEGKEIPQEQLLSSIFSQEQGKILAKLLIDYWDSLIEHTNNKRAEMNKLNKYIKRQERTRGDASVDERQRFKQIKQNFDRLLQNAIELGEYLCRSIPEMPEESSDEDREVEAAVHRLNTELSEGRVMLWPDRDTQQFYESLMDVTAYTPTTSAQIADEAAFEAEQQQREPQIINEYIDNVDLSCLEAGVVDMDIVDEEEDVNTIEETDETTLEQEKEEFSQRHSASRMSASPPPSLLGPDQPIGFIPTQNFYEFLDRLPQCINRELIDAAALDFLKQYARIKGHRKRLIQNCFLQAPADRLDLLPFYGRFLATIRLAYPDITMQLLHELLHRFRLISQDNVETSKKSEIREIFARIESKLHLCAFLSEMCKFGILPKAEALNCLRSLLVQLRSYKVDMLCLMIEQMGPFLYRSPDAHAKMSVIMKVLKEKSINIKDPRHKIILENSYYAVIPPEDKDKMLLAKRMPPMHEFIINKLATDIRVGIFRRIPWDNLEIREFTLKLLSSPWRIQFDQIARLASLVSALTDHHDWIGINVLDNVLEFIRLSLESNSPQLQQKVLSSIVYLGQLFNYNVSNTATLFKVLYQFISLGIQPLILFEPLIITEDQLIVRLQRIKMACVLVDIVCEFFGSGKSKQRMDHFLYFFLRFYYETIEAWSQFIEDLDEFPENVEQSIMDLFHNWRKDEKFPKTLTEAREKIVELEKIYKPKVDELLSTMRLTIDAKEVADRKLKQIIEENEELCNETEDEEEEEQLENEEEDSLDEDGVGGGHHRQKQYSKQASIDLVDQQQSAQSCVEQAVDEDEIIHVNTKQQIILAEDEDFMRDFDKMMADSLQSAPVTIQGPMSDLIVPPQAKQKFERKLTFVTPSSPNASSHGDSASGEFLLPTKTTLFDEYNQLQQESHTTPIHRMALMLKKGAGPGAVGGLGTKTQVLLKPVQIAESENLQEKWRRAREQREHDRREMKKVTLALNERMTQEAEELHRKEQITEMQRKLVLTGSILPGSRPEDGADNSL